MKTAKSNDIYQWQEFKDFARRLGILERPDLELIIRLKPGHSCEIDQRYLAIDNGNKYDFWNEVKKMKNKMYLLVGQIGCGKSTLARKLADKNRCLVINDDSIVTSVHGGNYKSYDSDLKPLYKSIESTIIHTAAAIGRSVVIDKVLLSKTSRSRFISVGKSLEFDIVAVIFPMVSVEEAASRRYTSDHRGYLYGQWLEVANRQQKEYSPPIVSEGFDEIYPSNLLR